jgi:excisionase family DNA binding protein
MSDENPDTKEKVFVSAEVVAKKYSVTRQAVLQWANEGIIPCIRIGSKTRRFSLDDVSKALEGAKP